MNTEEILNNVPNLTADQLFELIKEGKITLEILQKEGNLDAFKRREIQKRLKELEVIDIEAWEKAKYGNELTLTDYITKFPNGQFVQEAKDKIDNFERIRKENIEKKQQILDDIKSNPNAYDPSQILNFIRSGSLTYNDLRTLGIPENILEKLKDIEQPKLVLGETPKKIPNGYTEVYFWGMPGSGKTCALAAILSTVHKKGFLKSAEGPGFQYMTRLKNIFISKIAVLPPPTPLESTQYLPFALKTKKEVNDRSVSLIELSGEIFQCFLYKKANIELLTDSHKTTFTSLMEFLKSDNRKIHFFFIDYERKDEVDSDGFTQSDYLEAASDFFNKQESKIFKKSTDAIYVVVTKADLMHSSEKERISIGKEYLEGFLSFINTLRDICKRNGINGGELKYEPFSLGKVYFQQLCEFDNSTALEIIKIIMERIRPSKKSILDFFNK